MKIGVISDTHGHLDRRVPELFAGVDHILHAGDIGPPAIILELEQIAPVTAVLGNNDFGGEYRETELAECAGVRLLVHHIVDPRRLTEPLRRRLRLSAPHAVVFGHTHQPFNEVIDGTLFLNPGYAGRPRFRLERSVALLHVEGTSLRPEFLPLGTGSA